jgi:hypothetical protein
MRVVIAIPTRGKPHPAFGPALDAMRAAAPGWGWSVETLVNVDSCYVARARNALTAEVLKREADVAAFVDDDVTLTLREWRLLVEAPTNATFGAYRLKQEIEDYPVTIDTDELGAPIVSAGTGYVRCAGAPAGCLAIKHKALAEFASAHADRAYDQADADGQMSTTILDLWPQGLADRRWWGEDYGFCRLWTAWGGAIWCDPRLKPTHWGFDAQGAPKPFYADIDAWLRAMPDVSGERDAA